MNNKKGSAIAEAALVFPAVITVVLIVVHIHIALYADASCAVSDHMSLRAESGKRTGTVDAEEGLRNTAPDDMFGRKPFLSRADIIEGYRFPDNLLLAKHGSVYVIDEADYVRKSDLLKGATDEM